MRPPPQAAERDIGETTVVVVGSDRAFHRALARRLASEGHRVLDAESAELALYLCGRHAVDLVVAAQRLPGLTGIELCRLLRQRSGPPVMLVADGEPRSARASFLEDGADACVDRNDDLAPVVARARAVIRRTQPPPAALPGRS